MVVDVVFQYRLRGPVAGSRHRLQRPIDVRLANASDEVAGALRHYGTRLEVVGLHQKSVAWVDATPHVAECLVADLAHARNQCLRVDRFGNGLAPRQRVERAEVIGCIRHGTAWAGIAERMRQGGKGSSPRVPDAIDILEPWQVIALRRRRDQVATPL